MHRNSLEFGLIFQLVLYVFSFNYKVNKTKLLEFFKSPSAVQSNHIVAANQKIDQIIFLVLNKFIFNI